MESFDFNPLRQHNYTFGVFEIQHCFNYCTLFFHNARGDNEICNKTYGIKKTITNKSM